MLYQGKVGDDQAELINGIHPRASLLLRAPSYVIHGRHGIREKVRFKMGILDEVENRICALSLNSSTQCHFARLC